MNPSARSNAAAEPAFAYRGGVAHISSLDHALFARLRFILALAGLIATAIDPPTPMSLALVVYPSIAAYLGHSIVVASSSATWARPSPARWLHWADVLFFAYLLWLTGGGQSIFFVCFLFPVMTAAFLFGFREGMLVTVASTAFFLLAAVGAPPGDQPVEINRLLLRPVYLLSLGYMLAHWGAYEVRFRRQIMFLETLQRGRNPRLGAAIAIGTTLRNVCDFYKATECVLLLREADKGSEPAYTSSGGDLPVPVRAVLDDLVTDRAMTCELKRGVGRRTHVCYAYDVAGTPSRAVVAASPWAQAARSLGVDSLLMVPYLHPGALQGCLIVAGGPRFSFEDVAFMLHVSAALSMIVENTQLIEEIIASAAERERARASLDVHDRTIQPYIALRMGLEALSRDVDDQSPLKVRVHELIAMANQTVGELRSCVELRSQNEISSPHALVAALQEHAQRYERFFGLRVDIQIDTGPALGALSSDVYNIVVEGLSNIRKHTRANNAYVRLVRNADAVEIRIGNDATDMRVSHFTPRSIVERANSLGGSVRVAPKDGYTWVNVHVPV